MSMPTSPEESTVPAPAAPPAPVWGPPASPMLPPQGFGQPVVPRGVLPTPVMLPPRSVLPPDATSGGLAFPRLVFARRRPQWWTPLAVGGIAAGFFLVFSVVLTVVLFVVIMGDPAGLDSLYERIYGAVFDLTDPWWMAFILGSIAIMLPSYALASLIINGKGLGFISSVAGRLRWGWMMLCVAAAVAVAAISTAVSFLLPGDGSASSTVISPSQNPAFWGTFIVLLLLVPVQAAAEEYVFRGYLMQAIGRWLRHPAFAILLPVPLFVLGHLYEPIGQLSVGIFAVAAGWLTWRTGGLEAAIAIHIINNLLAFGLSLFGLSDANDAGGSWMGLVHSVLLIGVFCVVVEMLQRKTRLRRTVMLTPPAQTPPAQIAPVGPPVG